MSMFLLVSLGFIAFPLVLICLTELLGRCKLLAVLQMELLKTQDIWGING